MKNRIAEVRKSKHITQEQLAQALHTNRAYLSNLENGKNDPSVDLGGRIAQSLGETVESIFFTDDVRHERHKHATLPVPPRKTCGQKSSR
ncbi:helix-turn-helix transcriptional regulator [Lentilactobacillus parakefiri]|uniref:Putative transcriptional regulator n=1 Tax=Lentilactobacillus parakefiri TaxID=152332 RepID=A0A224VLA7_9LACO|nr:helix-turn-helix transcriptional regulator [Lentilactobacillus parakefiri]TDG90641.1 hypothetical protein C5L28_002146 [Lentilactobacillus parakefiri]GAW73094.1 putative transcriptional regulator [Lentilactobacillus parakefiri]